MAYTPSENVKKKERDYYAHLYNNNPGEFSSDYIDKANKALADIENRGEFKYNPATDIGYQAARKQYTQGGKQAMKETLGIATELTGGYDNSYAQTAAQQTFNKYMGELAALMPQYEGQAYDRYITEGQQMTDYLGILNNALDRDYARHQDKVNTFNADADRLYRQYLDAYNEDYGAYQDAVANDQWERTFAHNTAMDQASATAAQTNANADYYSALAKYNDSLAEDEPNLYRPAYIDEESGLAYYYNSDGKLEKYAVGANPYTGLVNPDAKNKNGEYDPSKVFSNGYQPNNVGGRKLTESNYEPINLYGKTQKIWTDGNRFYYWNGQKNVYEDITDLMEEE